jgi:hypothetical protein
MPEDTGIHPGSWLGDAAEEFKKLPTWGKFAIAGVGVLVVVLAIRARQSAASSGTLPATSSAPGSSSPFPMVGNVPLLPSGTNPVYDPSGNLVGFQSGSQAPGGTTVPPIIGGQNQPPSNPPLQGGNPPIQGQLPSGPLIPFGQYKGPSYSNLQPNTFYNYQGTNYRLVAGAQGRLWGVNPGGQQVLLYEPQSSYGTGAGPDTQSFMANPVLYHQAGQPHISSAHVRQTR